MGFTRKAVLGSLRVLLLLAVVLGAGWFVVSLTYDDEQPRMQANEGLDAVQDAMLAVVEFHRDKGRLPTAGEIRGVAFRPEPHVRSAAVDAGGGFTVIYQGRREIAGKTLRLTPYTDKDGGLRWRCELADIDPRWWPDYCRHTPQS